MVNDTTGICRALLLGEFAGIRAVEGLLDGVSTLVNTLCFVMRGLFSD